MEGMGELERRLWMEVVDSPIQKRRRVSRIIVFGAGILVGLFLASVISYFLN